MIISVDHNACILCDRCVRACNEVRHNEVLGRMNKGFKARISFDLNDPMGNSSCVSCGECMASCPTGALTNKKLVGSNLAAEPGALPVSLDDLFTHELLRASVSPLWNGIKDRSYEGNSSRAKSSVMKVNLARPHSSLKRVWLMCF